MIATTPRSRARSASSSGCPTRCSSRRAAYERWDGRGWPGELEGEAIPLAARIAQLAEFVEVAHRVGGVGGGDASWRASGAASSSTRRWPTCSCADADAILARARRASTTWDAVIDAEPALAVVLSRRAVRRRAGGDRATSST